MKYGLNGLKSDHFEEMFVYCLCRIKAKALQVIGLQCFNCVVSVLGVGLEPTQPQWPRDFKSLVSTDSTIRAAGYVDKNASDKICGAKIIAFFGFCKKKVFFACFSCLGTHFGGRFLIYNIIMCVEWLPTGSLLPDGVAVFFRKMANGV